MRKLITTIALLFLVSTSAAIAQTASPRNPAAAPSMSSDQQLLPEAPVGHRQPHAKDVAPAEMPPADQATRDLDKALAKKLTICRGC